MRDFTKVYTIHFDAENYRLMQETLSEMYLRQKEQRSDIFDGSSKKEQWGRVSAEWLDHEENNGLPIPDITGYGATVLSVSNDVLEFISSCLEFGCEVLPVSIDDQSWYVLNTVDVIDAIDRNLSIINMRHGRPSRTKLFKRFVLDSSKISSLGLFKVKDAGLTIFCTNTPNGFYDLIKKNNFTGVIFDEVELS